MRIALVSDIHGNLVSLDAVLATIEREPIDQIVCLGDVAPFGPQPRQVLARLRAWQCPCVMGNHDRELLDPKAIPPDAPSWSVEMLQWCAAQLSDEDLDHLRSFQPLIEIPLGEGANLLCFHGSPRSNTELILPTTSLKELDEMLAGYTATVMASGHTHVQMARQYRTTMVVNVGSVGWPLEEMSSQGQPRFLPWAEYAIVTWADGVLSIDLRRVPIDLEAVNRTTLNSDLPGRDDWVKLWTTPT